MFNCLVLKPFTLIRYQNLNYKGFSKNVVFKPVALVRKKLWAILDIILTDQTFNTLHPTL